MGDKVTDIDNIVINKSRLRLILEKADIDRNIGKEWDKLIAVVGFAIGIAGINNTYIRIVLICLMMVDIVIFAIRFYKACTNPVNADTIYKQIEENNIMTVHRHSIVLIKDTFSEYPNKYLVYDDKRWGCKLFPNYHTTENLDDNIENIRKHLSLDLKVPIEGIRGVFDFEEKHTKYSESHKEERLYLHDFYTFVVDGLKPGDFEIDGREYFWLSLSEMEADENILKKNGDVIDFVKKAS